MSADNGIYILRTGDKQHRVLYVQGIEQIYWDEYEQRYLDMPNPTALYNLFSICKHTRDGSKAIGIAIKKSKEYPNLEYGIRIISTEMTWHEISLTKMLNGHGQP